MPKPAVPVLAGLVVGVLFLAANIAALHDLRPHGARVAVPNAGPGFEVVAVADPVAALRRREIYAAVSGDQFLYAGANGQAAGKGLAEDLAKGRTPVDVVPLQAGDANGLSLPQIVLGTILGGFFTGVLMAQLALGAPLWQRGLAYAAFAVLFGLAGALVVDPLLGVLTGHLLVVWAWIGVTAFVIALAVGALARVAGQAGLPIAMLVILILGNPSAGANAPTGYLPWLFRTIGPYLPPNALATGLIGTTYFDAGVLRPIGVLAAWALVSAAVLATLDRTRGSRRPLAYDAAGAADDRADRDAHRLASEA